MVGRAARWFMALLMAPLLFWQADAQAAPQWQTTGADGRPEITLYFFWSDTCPHCAEAHPFIDALPEHLPWLKLASHQVQNQDSIPLWQEVVAETKVPANTVPYFAYCGKATVGYGGEGITGQFLIDQLKACFVQAGGELTAEEAGYQAAGSESTVSPFATCSEESLSGEDGTCGVDLGTSVQVAEVPPVDLPLIGKVAPETLSLPLLTVVLAGVDAFNPCAFFVLLFLLSIMVNAKSRARMLIVGGIFVFFSGFIYFLFMGAWLNVFALLGGRDSSWIMVAAGCLALTAGGINLREYATTKGDVSLSMSAENRTGLIKRMGQLTKASSMSTMIFGTVVLAILANAYELLCTAGFPMIYTSVLTLHELPDATRYLYLVFYNVVYVIPLLAIVIAFAMTMGKRKLTEKEGQTLKLMSGLMMMGMGGMLVIDPTSMQSPGVAIGLILGALLLTVIIVALRKWREAQQART